MSLAIEFLSAHLEQVQTTQADYAKAAGIDPSLFTKLVQGEVTLSSKNVPKLLRGIRGEQARLEFLVKYLEDQIPADFNGEISVRLTKAGSPVSLAQEVGDEAAVEDQMIHAFSALPSDLYRRRVVKFLNHLKKDASLRDLFNRTLAYLEESDLK